MKLSRGNIVLCKVPMPLEELKEFKVRPGFIVSKDITTHKLRVTGVYFINEFKSCDKVIHFEVRRFSMNEINYSRQNLIPELKVIPVATVLGAGGLGTWVAYFLAISGVPRIKLFALGTVLESDLARFPFTADQVGVERSKALAAVIQHIRPKCEVINCCAFRPVADDDSVEGAIFNCAAGKDGFDQYIHGLAQSKGIPYVSGAYHGLNFGIMPDAAVVLEPCQEPVGSWAPVLAMTAALMIQSVIVKPTRWWGSIHDLANSSPQTNGLELFSIGEIVAR